MWNNVKFWSTSVTIAAMETQQYLVFLLLLDVAVKNINVLNVVMEVEKWVLPAMISSDIIIRTASKSKY